MSKNFDFFCEFILIVLEYSKTYFDLVESKNGVKQKMCSHYGHLFHFVAKKKIHIVMNFEYEINHYPNKKIIAKIDQLILHRFKNIAHLWGQKENWPFLVIYFGNFFKNFDYKMYHIWKMKIAFSLGKWEKCFCTCFWTLLIYLDQKRNLDIFEGGSICH